jgi:hypothetical protein
MRTQSPARPANTRDEPADRERGSGSRAAAGERRSGYRTEIELWRDVAELSAQVRAQAVETAMLRRELDELRSSIAGELRTQQVVLVQGQQSTTIRPGSIWLRHGAVDGDDGGSPRPGSDLGLAALDTWTGVLLSIEANGIPHLTADLLATVENEPYSGVVCHLDQVTRAFSVVDDAGDDERPAGTNSIRG